MENTARSISESCFASALDNEPKSITTGFISFSSRKLITPALCKDIFQYILERSINRRDSLSA